MADFHSNGATRICLSEVVFKVCSRIMELQQRKQATIGDRSWEIVVPQEEAFQEGGQAHFHCYS